MASLLPNAEQTFVDGNGVPYASGTVGFYIPNTLTPKATWQDAGHAIVNTDPVVLDAAGRAIIYGDGVYRQILRDVFGNLIWDQLTAGTGSGGRIVNPVIEDDVAIDNLDGIYPIENNTGGGITITMPVSPNDGDAGEFADVAGNAGVNYTSFDFGSRELTTGGSIWVMGYNFQVISFTWLDDVGKWLVS